LLYATVLIFYCDLRKLNTLFIVIVVVVVIIIIIIIVVVIIIIIINSCEKKVHRL